MENASNLLQRAFVELEIGEWAEADKLLEQVLNLEPRNAQVYIGKLMVELRVTEESKLAEQTVPIDRYANFKKAVHLAEDEKKKLYISYAEKSAEQVKQGIFAIVERYCNDENNKLFNTKYDGSDTYCSLHPFSELQTIISELYPKIPKIHMDIGIAIKNLVPANDNVLALICTKLSNTTEPGREGIFGICVNGFFLLNFSIGIAKKRTQSYNLNAAIYVPYNGVNGYLKKALYFISRGKQRRLEWADYYGNIAVENGLYFQMIEEIRTNVFGLSFEEARSDVVRWFDTSYIFNALDGDKTFERLYDIFDDDDKKHAYNEKKAIVENRWSETDQDRDSDGELKIATNYNQLSRNQRRAIDEFRARLEAIQAESMAKAQEVFDDDNGC